ncbi:helix-turn-helix domain-containing protein [uncultured Enterovirga sp.]|uniref:helix-turn-helix domain-containing protein n=1 Tax=uncultured Enterovirga sp. TaxID=2026352 RepID=UPI0035CB679E
MLGSTSHQGLDPPPLGEVTPPPENRRSLRFDGGLFQAADRPLTAEVEGTIRPTAPLLMVTLRGGAERHQLTTAEGLRFDGADRAGMASYLPAHCERRLRLRNVAWGWASISLPVAEMNSGLARVGPFCGIRDPVIHGILAEMERLHTADGALQPEYCETAARMLAAYVAGRFGNMPPRQPGHPTRLTARQISRIEAYVEAHLDGPVRVSALAGLLGISEGHFHRAFRTTTGEAPLAFVGRRRIERAIGLMQNPRLGLTEIAAEVGFASPSAFARQFRALTEFSPSAYRRRLLDS